MEGKETNGKGGVGTEGWRMENWSYGGNDNEEHKQASKMESTIEKTLH